MLLAGTEPSGPARGFSLQAAVWAMLRAPDCALQTPWAQSALPACFSAQHRRGSSLQASPPGSYAVLLLLTSTALQELGKGDFTLLFSLEQKLTRARERNLGRLNHNLGSWIQVWHGRNNPAPLIPRETPATAIIES